MLSERKRGKWFYIEGRIAGERIRLAIRTQNRENARATISEVERALAGGPQSSLWPKLQAVLPRKSFDYLARISGYEERPSIPLPSWAALGELFEADSLRRIALGKFRETTWERYKFEVREFSEFLKQRGAELLEQVDRPLVEQYKVWRVSRIQSRSKLGEAKSLALSVAIL